MNKMSRVFAYVAFLVVTTAHAEYFNTYKNGEMAPYMVDPDTMGASYERRLYAPQKWVTTRVSTPSMGYAGNVAFMRLYRYITGANMDINGQRREIKMTAPVLTRVDNTDRRSYYGSNSFETSFYLPTIFQDNPPTPLDENVYIKEIGPLAVYVKTYSGWSTTQMRSRMYEQLKKELKNDGLSFVDSYYYSAGYNSPMDVGKRRNEVWVVAILK